MHILLNSGARSCYQQIRRLIERARRSRFSTEVGFLFWRVGKDWRGCDRGCRAWSADSQAHRAFWPERPQNRVLYSACIFRCRLNRSPNPVMQKSHGAPAASDAGGSRKASLCRLWRCYFIVFNNRDQLRRRPSILLRMDRSMFSAHARRFPVLASHDRPHAPDRSAPEAIRCGISPAAAAGVYAEFLSHPPEK